ncbi:MAG TPA: hypothetical protein PK762_13185, partial [Candidatus Kapabacteria bacterium]|nr:hypothetical protein [Candidatus Kapabacteria bacterium]
DLIDIVLKYFVAMSLATPLVKQMLHLKGDVIILSVILAYSRIHLIIIQRYSILAISLKHLGLPKCNK